MNLTKHLQRLPFRLRMELLELEIPEQNNCLVVYQIPLKLYFLNRPDSLESRPALPDFAAGLYRQGKLKELVTYRWRCH